MRVPRTMGCPDTLPGTCSISSQAIQSTSASVFVMLLTLLSRVPLISEPAEMLMLRTRRAAYRVSTFPGRAFVILPSSMTGTPFTSTIRYSVADGPAHFRPRRTRRVPPPDHSGEDPALPGRTGLQQRARGRTLPLSPPRAARPYGALHGRRPLRRGSAAHARPPSHAAGFRGGTRRRPRARHFSRSRPLGGTGQIQLLRLALSRARL